MANHKEMDEKDMIIRLQKSEITFHVIKLIFVVTASLLTAVYIVSYVRHDNDRTRDLICNIAGKVQLQTEDCK